MPRIEGGESSEAQKRRIGKHIRGARKKLRLTQREVALRVGVTTTTVCDWENGRTYPSTENLRKLGPILGETVSFLISDRLGKKESLERVSGEIAAALGYNRLSALLALPQARLRREVDALIGRFVVEEGGIPKQRRG